MRRFLAFLLLLVFVGTACADETKKQRSPKRFIGGVVVRVKNELGKPWVRSVALNGLAIGLDIHSSRGLRELNPLFRRPDGLFDMNRAILFKSGFALASFGTQGLIRIKYPEKADKYFPKINYGYAIFTGGSAVRNYWYQRKN